LKSPFGGDGWIVSVDNMEDIVGGHIWIGTLEIFGGIWHIFTKPWAWARRAFVWSGEAYLSYSLAAIALMGWTAAMVQQVLKPLNRKLLLFWYAISVLELMLLRHKVRQD
jgi:hypothetical protein